MTFTKVSHFFQYFYLQKKEHQACLRLGARVASCVFVLTLKAGECCFLGLGYLGVRHH